MPNISRRALLSALSASPGASSPRELPNIVYVLADDLGYGDLRCYNPQSSLVTPHADRLAREGIRFTDMHSGSAVCTPTRYGILTGRYAWRTRLKSGVLDGYSPDLIESGRLTVPGMLQRLGYYTAGVGKWHLGLGTREKTDFAQPLDPGPAQHGFDYYFGIPASLDMPPYLYFENARVVEAPTATTEGRDRPRGMFWRPGPIAPSFRMEEVLPTLAAKAETILRERAVTRGRPFFLYFPLTAPHTPWAPARRYLGRSRAGFYGDFVEQVDATLGGLLRTLDETGLTQNTLLIFTSDNGADWKPEDKARYPHRANAGWRGEKADIWEGGHRIPFLARWPGKVPAGAVSSELGCLTDLAATTAALTATPLPANAAEDSWNLLPALLGKPGKPIREAIVHHSVDGMFAIRQGNWKLELGLGSGGFSAPRRVQPEPGGPRGQLYDLAADPGEDHNVWAKHPSVVAHLTALLEKYRREGRSRPM